MPTPDPIKVLGKTVTFIVDDMPAILKKSGNHLSWSKYHFDVRQWLHLSDRTRTTKTSLFDNFGPTGSTNQQRAALLQHLDHISRPDRLYEGLRNATDEGILIAWRQLQVALRVEAALTCSPYPYVMCQYEPDGWGVALVAMTEEPDFANDRPPLWFLWITRRDHSPSSGLNQWERLLQEEW
jgi:hypothetical protein